MGQVQRPRNRDDHHQNREVRSLGLYYNTWYIAQFTFCTGHSTVQYCENSHRYFTHYNTDGNPYDKYCEVYYTTWGESSVSKWKKYFFFKIVFLSFNIVPFKSNALLPAFLKHFNNLRIVQIVESLKIGIAVIERDKRETGLTKRYTRDRKW